MASILLGLEHGHIPFNPLYLEEFISAIVFVNYRTQEMVGDSRQGSMLTIRCGIEYNFLMSPPSGSGFLLP